MPVEKVIEKPVYIERIQEVPREVNKVKEIDLKTQTENVRTVEKVVEREKHVNTVLDKNVEVLVEKVVQVPVEKVVEVEVGVRVEKPVFNEVVLEEDLVVETLNEETREVTLPEEVTEHDDEELAR